MGTALGFTKGKSYQPNPIAFYDEVTEFVNEGRAADVIYPDLPPRLSPTVFSYPCEDVTAWVEDK